MKIYNTWEELQEIANSEIVSMVKKGDYWEIILENLETVLVLDGDLLSN